MPEPRPESLGPSHAVGRTRARGRGRRCRGCDRIGDKSSLLPRSSRMLKRAMDLVVAASMLTLSFPFLVLLASP